LGGGVWIASAPFAEVLKKHDLGRNQLAKVTLLKTDGKTPIEGEYYCLAFAEFKDTFDLEESKELKEWTKDSWSLTLAPKNDQVALRRSALSGPDLWFEKRFAKAFFLSDRLLTALRDAKVTRTLSPYRCRIVD
jgi:Immunity protein family (Imm11)